jgi:hypothetical protein
VNISKLSLEQVQALSASDRDDILVRMSGKDLGDYYFIVEDRRKCHSEGHSVSHFMMFLEDEPEKVAIHQACSTMVEAALHYAFAFVIDNCDGADASDPVVSARHNVLQEGLRNLVK